MLVCKIYYKSSKVSNKASKLNSFISNKIQWYMPTSIVLSIEFFIVILLLILTKYECSISAFISYLYAGPKANLANTMVKSNFIVL